MRKQVPLFGSLYLESQLFRAWPVLFWKTCVLCDKQFRRQWMWKFRKRGKLYHAEPSNFSYCCTECTSTNYHEALIALDTYYRDIKFDSLRKGYRDG